ncbi:unnamed protein product [Mytilus edulis]|uniref:Endonuclease/exonuclease/phosphatase domain-containing protein n=1 Tax=Mytilus edulis TaxID=6550 RepID=A0A8S3U1Q6_MYTED|nr:unnamed protein product [Mytilus edulis]
MSSTLCLANLLESTNCDLAIISEHKLKPNLLSYMNSIDMRYKSISKTDKLNDLYNCTHGKGGISILYKASLQFSVEEILETNSDRIVGIELKNKSFGSIFIFGVYLPADGSIDNYRQELNALDDLYTYYINYGKVVVAGDFNASCINKNLQFTNTTKSKELQNFVHRHNICHPFIDTCKILPKGPEFTFTLKNTMLDYILIDETLVRQLRRYEILEEGTFSSTSDHLPVIACVELDENPHIDLNNFSKLPAWHKINEHSIKEYQDKLCAPLDILIQEAQNNDIDINLFYHNLVNTLINTAKETIPCNMYNPHTKPYWNADVKQAHTKERNMRRVWMQDGRPRGMQHESYFNYKRAKRDFRNIQKLANEQYIEETYDDINNAAECDIRLFWKLIKRQKPKHSKVCQQIIHNNIVHTSPESICNAFANYFEDLYTPADTSTFDDPTLNEMNKAYREIQRVCKADEDLYLPGGIISCDDVSSIIKQLKRRKACGNDMIQNEHLIYGGPKVSECLSIFLNIVVEKQQVPSDWQKGLVVPLFKGGDKSKLSPDSYRPVCLLSSKESEATSFGNSEIVDEPVSKFIYKHNIELLIEHFVVIEIFACQSNGIVPNTITGASSKLFQSLPALGQDVRRLAHRSYPSDPNGVRKTVTKEQFIDGLMSVDMRLRIKQARPADLNDAIRHAVELEAFNKAEINREEGKCYLRATNTGTSDTSDKTAELLKTCRQL